jgi:hypothetical protein
LIRSIKAHKHLLLPLSPLPPPSLPRSAAAAPTPTSRRRLLDRVVLKGRTNLKALEGKLYKIMVQVRFCAAFLGRRPIFHFPPLTGGPPLSSLLVPNRVLDPSPPPEYRLQCEAPSRPSPPSAVRQNPAAPSVPTVGEHLRTFPSTSSLLCATRRSPYPAGAPPIWPA